MKLIDKNDIDFSILTSIGDTRFSTLYHDEEDFYKILTDQTYKELKLRLLKLNILSFEQIPNVVTANKLIFEPYFFERKFKFYGYVQNYIKSETLSDYLLKRENDISLILKVIKEVSLSLRKIHDDPRNIIVGDMHFNNIIITGNLNHFFVDCDSYIVDGIPGFEYPTILKKYVINRGVDCEINKILSQNTDRLCLIINTLILLFDCVFPDDISIYEYDKKAEQIRTLKNLRECFIKITSIINFLPIVPYIDEFISEEDISKQIIL